LNLLPLVSSVPLTSSLDNGSTPVRVPFQSPFTELLPGVEVNPTPSLTDRTLYFRLRLFSLNIPDGRDITFFFFLFFASFCHQPGELVLFREGLVLEEWRRDPGIFFLPFSDLLLPPPLFAQLAFFIGFFFFFVGLWGGAVVDRSGRQCLFRRLFWRTHEFSAVGSGCLREEPNFSQATLSFSRNRILPTRIFAWSVGGTFVGVPAKESVRLILPFVCPLLTRNLLFPVLPTSLHHYAALFKILGVRPCWA